MPRSQSSRSSARANLELAEETLERLLPLQPKGYVTDQQVQDARTAKRDAEVSLEQALQQSKAADALISTPEETLAVIEARRAASRSPDTTLPTRKSTHRMMAGSSA
nr:hypothetical protein [Marinicella sp. W31]MDC2879655.1 hypothetical protein [Marinicella sp. W31]